MKRLLVVIAVVVVMLIFLSISSIFLPAPPIDNDAKINQAKINQPLSTNSTKRLSFDKWLGSGLARVSQNPADKINVNFASKVSKIKSDKFIYYYRLTNDSSKTEVFVAWNILSVAAGLGDLGQIVHLKPNETKEYILTSEFPPVFESGMARMFYRVSGNDMTSIANQYRFQGPPQGFWLRMGGSCCGFIPEHKLYSGYLRSL